MTDDKTDELLARALKREVAVADRVELPVRSTPRLVPLLQWSGWLAAGLLATVMWTDRAKSGEASSTPPASVASEGDARTPDTELVSTGAPSFAVGELPAMMIESRPAPGGGYDVLLMRRTLERAHVSELVQLAEDEHGNATDLPIPAAATYATEGM